MKTGFLIRLHCPFDRRSAVFCGSLFVTCALLFGCASTPVDKLIRFEATGVSFLQEAGQKSQAAGSPWDSVIEAAGRGLPAPNAVNDAQKQLTAQEAARYRALAKLAEELEGLKVTRVARVTDMAFAGEEVNANLSVDLKGITEVASTYDAEAEIAEVTLRVVLGSDGKTIPQRISRLAPASIYERKAQAEEAARIRAMASLREQIGRVYVSQSVEVEDLMLARQEARLHVEGLLEGVEFSDVRWTGNKQCEVTAVITVPEGQLKERRLGLSGD